MSGSDDDLVIPETVPVDLAGRESPAFGTAALAELIADEPPTDPGQGVVGRFVLAEELGRGGMGRVVAARDPRLRRTVAIKLLKGGARSENALSRFVAEAQVTGQLDHPNIVPVHELGVTGDGEPWFAMKRVQGRSLAEVIKDLRAGVPGVRARWSRHRLLTAFVQICNAIAYAHDRGVLHRDLKPSNVMLGPFGEVLVMDWGVAGLMGRRVPSVPLDQATTLAPGEDSFTGDTDDVERSTVAATQEGATVGTPGYMSPEQTAGDLGKLDGRSDVFALGAILYEILTLQRAYTGPNLFAVVHALMSGPPTAPAEKAPDEAIPDEIAYVAMKALRKEASRRYPTASALGEAVQAFLEGSRRRAEAAERLESARRHRERWLELLRERESLAAQIDALRQTLPPWTPIPKKRDLLLAQERAGQIDDHAQDAFDALVGACEAALSHDPGGTEGPRLLAEAWWTRLQQAESEGDHRFARHCANRVRAWDRTGLSSQLDAPGALSLRTDPPGAEVVARPVRTEGLVWSLGPPRALGRTPLQRVPLGQGSWVVTLSTPGRPDTTYPVHLTRGWHWDAGVDVPLYTAEQIGAGWRYVPPGPFICGGDPEGDGNGPTERPWVDGYFIQELPLCMADWLDWVNALHAEDPEEAWRRVPRTDKGGEPYWTRPPEGTPYVLPDADRHGDRWDPEWPLFCVSWDDAVAYAAWLTRTTGLLHTLPSEHQFEKAGRGVDGRVFPWGNRFDATLCMMRDSDPAMTYPRRRAEAASDVSVYGVRDLAGGVHEWCAGDSFNGLANLRPVRGASWVSPERWCRMASRFGTEPDALFATYGFRLVRHAPLP